MTDLFQQAMNPNSLPQPETLNIFEGQIEIDLKWVVLIRGQGRVPYDATRHAHLNPNIEISMRLHCTRQDGSNFLIERSMLAVDRRQPHWIEHTLPSLQALGVQREEDIHRKWARVEMVQAGTYTDKQGNEKQLTAMRVLELFDSAEEMLAADAVAPDEPAPTPAVQPAAARNGTKPSNGTPAVQQAREMALKQLPNIIAIAEQQGGDLRANVARLIETMPMFRQAGIGIDTPEVEDAISACTIPF